MEGLFLGHHVLVSRRNKLQWGIDLEENCQVTPQGRLLPPWTDAISWPRCQRSRANTAAYLSLGETWWPGIAHCAPHAGSALDYSLYLADSSGPISLVLKANSQILLV